MKEIVSRAMDQGGRLKVRSALNPALWFSAIVSLPVLSMAVLLEDPPSILFYAGVTPIFATATGFFFLLFFDRDKLQSEDYQIRKKSLEMIEQSDGKVAHTAGDLKLIANPAQESETD